MNDPLLSWHKQELLLNRSHSCAHKTWATWIHFPCWPVYTRFLYYLAGNELNLVLEFDPLTLFVAIPHRMKSSWQEFCLHFHIARSSLARNYLYLCEPKSRSIRKNCWGYSGGCSASAWNDVLESFVSRSILYSQRETATVIVMTKVVGTLVVVEPPFCTVRPSQLILMPHHFQPMGRSQQTTTTSVPLDIFYYYLMNQDGRRSHPRYSINLNDQNLSKNK